MKRFIFLAIFLSTPATAQEAEQADISSIESCLGEIGNPGSMDAHACVSAVADGCQKTEGSGSTAFCFRREAAAWNAIGAKRYEGLQAALKPEIASAVRAAQETWTAFRDAQCDATGEFFSQYSGSASAQWQAQCARDLAADRAILLDDWLMRSEDFE